MHFLEWQISILIRITLAPAFQGPIDNKSVFRQVMAWYRTSDRPLLAWKIWRVHIILFIKWSFISIQVIFLYGSDCDGEASLWVDISLQDLFVCFVVCMFPCRHHCTSQTVTLVCAQPNIASPAGKAWCNFRFKWLLIFSNWLLC